MYTSGALAVAALVGTAAAIGDKRSFSVMHFRSGPLTEGRSDPIVSPGGPSSHVHTILGSNAFSNNVTGQDLLTKSTCTNSMLQADRSAYWMPKLYFHDNVSNTYEPVLYFHMNVYYFFEASNDPIKAFPVGLQMVSGNALMRSPPPTGQDVLLANSSKGFPVQPAQMTCPRKSFDPPSYPPNSDGSMAGIQDPNDKGAGAGFPFAECDGYASPLRADLHFPSCYDPSKALNDFRNNMVWPHDAGKGKQDCPPGFIHVPHLFYELYWNTPKFISRWTPNSGYQPFVLANGDATGFSLHGDFMAAWNNTVLQNIIDNCDTGDRAMDTCPGDIGPITPSGDKCTIPNPSPEQIDGVLSKLPGNNPIFGWQYGGTGPVPSSSSSSSSSSTSSKSSTLTTSKATTTTSSKASTTTSSAKTSTTSAAPTGPKISDSNSFKYAGCYADGNPRTLTGITFANVGGSMTNPKCISYCMSKGYSMAGTEYSGQCFCGNSLNTVTKLDESKCNMTCEGDVSTICGGSKALSLYTSTGTVKRSAKMRIAVG